MSARAAGFAEGGAADALAPGAELVSLVAAVNGPAGTRLGALTDREVLGVLGAGHKLAASAELVILAEFTRRRPALLTSGVTSASYRARRPVKWRERGQICPLSLH